MSPTAGAVSTPNQREHILDVALGLMAEHGAAGTSMRKLASACNLNVAAIYHYFPSKADLLRSVIEERRYGIRLRDLPPLDTTLPPHDRVAALILAVGRGIQEEEATWRLLLGEALRGDPTATIAGTEILAAMEPAARGWLAELFPPGSEPAIDVDAVATALVNHVFSFFIAQLFHPAATRDRESERAASAFATLALATATVPTP
jgi:AcrR family transcriptional regulator